MTTIAYRDGVLAADSRATHNDIITGTAQKISALPNGDRVALLGARGEAETLREWYASGCGVAQPSTANAALVVIKTNGSIELFEDGHRQPTSDAAFYAWGTGAELALGAMLMGATAEQAVAAAIERDIYSGGEVRVLRQ